MAQRKGASDKFQPVRGLITEANEGRFPQDAAYDLSNVEILKTGEAQRRLALDAETDDGILEVVEITESDRDKGIFATYLWKLTLADETFDIRVIQVAEKVTFINDNAPLGGQTPLLVVNLNESPYTIGKSVVTTCQFAYGAGFLIIVNERCNPVVVEWDQTLGLQAEVLGLEIRARDLVTPFTEGSDYGTSLTTEEHFNLRNSGWPWKVTAAGDREGNSATTNQDPVYYFFQKIGVYPTHSTLYSALKLSAAKEVAAVGTFSPWEADKINFGNTIPPLGKYVHDAYNFNAPQLLNDDPDRVKVEDSPLANDIISGAPISGSNLAWSIQNRPTCVGFLNGHAVYGDIDQNNKARILVSQLAKEVTSLAKCYQEADPSADEINDLVATDGFVARPIGMGKPLSMHEVSKGLIILCSNGAWQLRGTAGAFSAVDSEFVKLASFKYEATQSPVIIGDALFFCAESGIHSVSPNDFGELQVNNVTRDTIDSLYLGYGSDRIRKMIGAYVQEQNYIYWLVPETAGDAYEVLVLNLDLGGFFLYDYRNGEDDPALHLPLAVTNTSVTTIQDPVTDEGEQVFDDGVLVTDEITQTSRQKESINFLCSYRPNDVLTNFNASFATNYFYDWRNLGDPYKVDNGSYIEFAYNYPEAMIGGVQAPYIHSFFEKGRAVLEDTGGGGPLPSQEYYRVHQVYYQVLERL